MYSFERLYKNTVVTKGQTRLSPSWKVLLWHSAIANYKLCNGCRYHVGSWGMSCHRSPLSSWSGTVRCQPISIFCKKHFSARIPNCIIMLIELCNDNANSSRTSLLLTVRRQQVNLIIFPLVLCLVPRVTSCSFWVKKYWRSGEGQWFNSQFNCNVLRYGEAFVVHCDYICSALESVQ